MPRTGRNTLRRHERGMWFPNSAVSRVSEDEWTVKSEGRNLLHTVTRTCSDCCFNCEETCQEPQCEELCDCMYSCSCEDAHLLCKHIHKVHSLQIKAAFAVQSASGNILTLGDEDENEDDDDNEDTDEERSDEEERYFTNRYKRRRRLDPIAIRHERGMDFSSGKITAISDVKFSVQSASRMNLIHTVEVIEESCDGSECNEMCSALECLNLCACMYTCSCEDHEENSLCKHIHAVHALRVKA